MSASKQGARGPLARPGRPLPGLVLALAASLLALWLARTPSEVFFPGDAALKSLVALQWAAGQPSRTFDPPAPDWARQCWDQGLSPLEPPLAFADGTGHLIGFPLPFPVITAPFAAALGPRGLYAVPALATVVTWLLALSAGRRLGLSPAWRALALAVLAFSTPLTLYGAMYWEHTVAVALTFAAVLPLLRRQASALTPWLSWSCGALAGLAAWFREESVVVAALLLVLALLPEPLRRACGAPRLRARWLLGGLAGSLGLYLALNVLVYGTPAGVRALQLAHWSHVGAPPQPALVILRKLTERLFQSFPLVWFVLAAAGLELAGRRPRVTVRLRLLLALAAGLALIMPLVPLNDGGKQFGPRYLLSAFPLLALAATLLLRALARRRGAGLRLAGGLVFAALVVRGAWVDSWLSPAELGEAGRKRVLVLEGLRSRPGRVVAVSDPNVALQASALFGERLLFTVRHGKQLKRLAASMAAHGERQLTYACNPATACSPFEGLPESKVLRLSDELEISAGRDGTAGQYLLYRLEIRAANR